MSRISDWKESAEESYAQNLKKAVENSEPCPLFACLAVQRSDCCHAREIQQYKEHECECRERGESCR